MLFLSKKGQPMICRINPTPTTYCVLLILSLTGPGFYPQTDRFSGCMIWARFPAAVSISPNRSLGGAFVSRVASAHARPPQHFLYFFPLPHGHGSFRPTLTFRPDKSPDAGRANVRDFARFGSWSSGSPSSPKSTPCLI